MRGATAPNRRPWSFDGDLLRLVSEAYRAIKFASLLDLPRAVTAHNLGPRVVDSVWLGKTKNHASS